MVGTDVPVITRWPLPAIVPPDQLKLPLTRTMPGPVIVPAESVRFGQVTLTPVARGSCPPPMESVPLPLTVGLPLTVNVPAERSSVTPEAMDKVPSPVSDGLPAVVNVPPPRERTALDETAYSP